MKGLVTLHTDGPGEDGSENIIFGVMSDEALSGLDVLLSQKLADLYEDMPAEIEVAQRVLNLEQAILRIRMEQNRRRQKSEKRRYYSEGVEE